MPGPELALLTLKLIKPDSLRAFLISCTISNCTSKCTSRDPGMLSSLQRGSSIAGCSLSTGAANNPERMKRECGQGCLITLPSLEMRVFGYVFCQNLKLAVGFDLAYHEKIGNHSNKGGQCLTKILNVVLFSFFFSVKHAQIYIFFFSLKTFQTCKLFRFLGHSAACGSQNEPGS